MHNVRRGIDPKGGNGVCFTNSRKKTTGTGSQIGENLVCEVQIKIHTSMYFTGQFYVLVLCLSCVLCFSWNK